MSVEQSACLKEGKSCYSKVKQAEEYHEQWWISLNNPKTSLANSNIMTYLAEYYAYKRDDEQEGTNSFDKL